MCLNEVTIIKEGIIPAYQKIKRNYEFHERFVTASYQPYYYWNDQAHTSLGHSLLVEPTNETCIKYSMAPQVYKVVTTHAHKFLGQNILSRLLHYREPHIEGMNDDIYYEFSSLELKLG